MTLTQNRLNMLREIMKSYNTADTAFMRMTITSDGHLQTGLVRANALVHTIMGEDQVKQLAENLQLKYVEPTHRS